VLLLLLLALWGKCDKVEREIEIEGERGRERVRQTERERVMSRVIAIKREIEMS
jgi:hypothetical protein